VGDVGVADDERRAIGRADRLPGRLGDGLPVVTVDLGDVPAHGIETPLHVLGERDVGGPVDRDSVVVVEVDEPPEAEVAGQRRRLGADPLHQVAVGDEPERPVIDELGAEPRPQVLLGDRQAHPHPEPLAERPGRHLDAQVGLALGMPRRGRAPLPERPQIVHPDPEPERWSSA
jgi:hypothetical protein